MSTGTVHRTTSAAVAIGEAVSSATIRWVNRRDAQGVPRLRRLVGGGATPIPQDLLQHLAAFAAVGHKAFAKKEQRPETGLCLCSQEFLRLGYLNLSGRPEPFQGGCRP